MRLQQGFVSGGMGFRIKLHSSNPEPLMSALSQKRILRHVRVMSAFSQKQTWFSTIVMSALCNKRTHALQQSHSIN